MKSFIKNDDAILVLSLMALIFPFYNAFPYLDDMVRLTYNYTGLIVQGRYLTEWFYTGMQGMNYTTFPDIYGFNLAFIVLCFVVVKRYVLDKHQDIRDYSLLFILCIFSSPFILENISYHIDSIGMFSSLTISIAAACANNKRFALRIAVSASLLFIATCFYQFSLNVYISTVAIIFLIKTEKTEDKDLLLYVSSKIIAMLACLVVYILIMKVYATDTYVDSHATIMSLEQIKSGILARNIGNVNSIIGSAFSPYYSIAFLILSLSSVVGIAYAALKNIRAGKFFSASCFVLCPAACLAMIYLPASVFSSPIIQPRILIAYGFFIFSLLVPSLSLSAIKKPAIIAVAILFSINVMTSSAFNKSQSFVINSTRTAMDKIYNEAPTAFRDNNGEIKVSLSGVYNHGMEFERNRKYFPVLDYLVRDPQKSPFLMNGLNRYFRTGVKAVSGESVKDCDYVGMASPWIGISTCSGNIVRVAFKDFY